MKKLVIGLLSASALCAGLCQVASAADLGVRAAPPPAPVVIAPTWTGFYIGGNVGAGWAKNDTSVSGAIPPAVLGAAVPFSLPLASQTMSGFIGGLQGGYNYQIGTFVIGVEADGDWGDVNGTAPCLVVVSCTSKIKSMADVGGRAGVVVDKALVYLKGGAAWAWTDFNTSVSLAGLNASQNLSTTRSGAFIGTGIEYAFMPNWTAKVEYDYYDFGSKTVSTSVAAAGVVLPLSATSKLTEQTVKFGVNYKFWAY
jgi:outer membrane immunogenic protein